MSRVEHYRSEIKSLILSSLSVGRVRELRKEYLEGYSTIAEFSQRTDLPPVLLWAVLTPLYERTHTKYKYLQLEFRIYNLTAKGASLKEIAKTLHITEREVLNYTKDRFSEYMYNLRPWYNARPVSVYEDEDKWAMDAGVVLPPASRIGQRAGELSDIDATKLGRCPTCGQKVHMPCYACAVKEYLKENRVPRAEDVADPVSEQDLLPKLMFR